MATKQVVVVGGGVIGLCCAYYALKRGFAVTVVEREEPGGDNCSMGNAGMIVPSHFTPLAAPGMIAKGLRMMLSPKSPFYIRPRPDPALIRWAWLFHRNCNARHVAACRELLRDLNMESRRLFHELAAEDDFGLVRRGLLMLCKTPKGLDEEAAVAQAAAEIGLQAEVLDAAATAKADPGVTMDVAGSVHFHDDCHLDPARFVNAMRSRIPAMGGRIESGIRIDEIQTGNGIVRSVSGSGRRFEGDHFVIAGGAWSAGLMKSVGLQLPLQPGKGYSLTLPSPPELPRLCSIFAEAKVAVTPMGEGLRFGGTMEIGGHDLSVNPARVQGIIRSVNAYFPRFTSGNFSQVTPWAGLRPVSPDGIPYLGPVSGLPNLIAATGHAMMGLSLAPVSGLLVAGWIAGDAPFRPIHSLSPNRF